jgi:hypothetical protein
MKKHHISFVDTKQNTGNTPSCDRAADFKYTVPHGPAYRHSNWPAELNCSDIRTEDAGSL